MIFDCDIPRFIGAAIDLVFLAETDFTMGTNDLILFVITVFLTVFHMYRAVSEIHFSYTHKRYLPRLEKRQPGEKEDMCKARKLEEAKGWDVNALNWYTTFAVDESVNVEVDGAEEPLKVLLPKIRRLDRRRLQQLR